ncbi:MAG: RbsD/FucU domain-containing protein [Candidatus Sulfotelmatobacter sp.]|jgi:D-ribose pyranose/furanose isomerase RbsD
MHTVNGRLRAISCVLVLLVSSSLSQTLASAPSSDWKAFVRSRLPLYGHRNWIVVADSAFPVYANPGIETIVVNDDLPSVLKYVASAISSSRHLRATVFLDQELQFIDEHDYPRVSELRKQITAQFPKEQASSIPHTDVMTKVDEAGKTFRILFIKTTTTIPYTSVYMRLDCGYMNDEVEQKIRAAMVAAVSRELK